MLGVFLWQKTARAIFQSFWSMYLAEKQHGDNIVDALIDVALHSQSDKFVRPLKKVILTCSITLAMFKLTDSLLWGSCIFCYLCFWFGECQFLLGLFKSHSCLVSRVRKICLHCTSEFSECLLSTEPKVVQLGLIVVIESEDVFQVKRSRLQAKSIKNIAVLNIRQCSRCT